MDKWGELMPKEYVNETVEIVIGREWKESDPIEDIRNLNKLRKEIDPALKDMLDHCTNINSLVEKTRY